MGKGYVDASVSALSTMPQEKSRRQSGKPYSWIDRKGCIQALCCRIDAALNNALQICSVLLFFLVLRIVILLTLYPGSSGRPTLGSTVKGSEHCLRARGRFGRSFLYFQINKITHNREGWQKQLAA